MTVFISARISSLRDGVDISPEASYRADMKTAVLQPLYHAIELI